MDPTDDDPTRRSESPDRKTERLKERVYITFTALAAGLALRAREESADAATVTFAIAVSEHCWPCSWQTSSQTLRCRRDSRIVRSSGRWHR